MGYIKINAQTDEIWAVVGEQNGVMWSRGGSSTSPKLMVYSKKETAERAMKSSWIKQQITEKVKIIKLIIPGEHGQTG